MSDITNSQVLNWEEFLRVEMRVGTVVAADRNPAAIKPAYVLKIDLGNLGVRTSSAQLTAHYSTKDLIGRQVVVVTNFPSKRVAGVRSEVLVLAAVPLGGNPVIIGPSRPVADGSRIA